MSELENTSLYRITQLPLDADAAIFRQYPPFKMGVVDSVRHYAELLLPLAKRIIAGDSDYTEWILTAPAITDKTPAAANLLCWELFELCKHDRDISSSHELSLMNIHHDRASTASMNWKDPTKSLDYAKLDFEDRVQERKRHSRCLVRNADFHGRPILFVNDICVTGAQQLTMQRYFDDAEAACVRWLYLIAVDQEIGRSNPRIEWEINSAPFENLLRMVSCEQIQFTGKCVQTLMHLSLAELDQVLRALNVERSRRLLELTDLNGFHTLDGFEEHVELVRSYCQEPSACSRGQTC
jgi:PRTase ComF-like